jgi:hypothetical protein
MRWQRTGRFTSRGKDRDMAFCPNCGTPNTDQAEKCVACSFDLAPQQKAKFRGTIIMSGIKATPSLATAETVPPPPETAPSTAVQPPPKSIPPPEPARPSLPAGRNPSFQQTMVGHMAPLASARSTRAETTSAPSDIARTNQGTDAPIGATTGSGRTTMPGSVPTPATFSASGTGTTIGPAAVPSYGEPGSPGIPRGDIMSRESPSPATHESTVPPSAPSTPNPGKVLAIGCITAFAIFCVVSGLLYYAIAPKLRLWLRGGDHDAEAVAWQASITQSLTQVAALCQRNCQDASPYFHRAKQAVLLGETKLLTPDRVVKLSDVGNTKAEMLHRTDDADRARDLGLDPQQCARVLAGTAKVISCSVPDPEGPNSVLRIVHLSGIGTL